MDKLVKLGYIKYEKVVVARGQRPRGKYSLNAKSKALGKNSNEISNMLAEILETEKAAQGKTIPTQGNIRELIQTLDGIGIDLDGEEETIVAGLRFELENMDEAGNTDFDTVNEHLSDFEGDWLDDIKDAKAKKEIKEAFKYYRGDKAASGKAIKDPVKAKTQQVYKVLQQSVEDQKLTNGVVSNEQILDDIATAMAPAETELIADQGRLLIRLSGNQAIDVNGFAISVLTGKNDSKTYPLNEFITGTDILVKWKYDGYRILKHKFNGGGTITKNPETFPQSLETLSDTLDAISNELTDSDEIMDFAELRFALTDKTNGKYKKVLKFINEFQEEKLPSFQNDEIIKNITMAFDVFRSSGKNAAAGTLIQKPFNVRVVAEGNDFEKGYDTYEEAKAAFDEEVLNYGFVVENSKSDYAIDEENGDNWIELYRVFAQGGELNEYDVTGGGFAEPHRIKAKTKREAIEEAIIILKPIFGTQPKNKFKVTKVNT